MAIAPLLRWRRDSFSRVRGPAIAGVIALVGLLVALSIWRSFDVLPLIGMALSVVLAMASFLPLRGRNLRRMPLAVWGMVIAHFGIALALFGMAADSALTVEKLAAARPGDVTQVGPWSVKLEAVEPVAGPNWTALEGRLSARYQQGAPVLISPQARSFWAPPQQTSESALLTRWNGQLYAVLGDETEDGRWQLRLWWKPFVTCIWYGGLLIALGGLLALIGRVSTDLRRRSAQAQIERRKEEIAKVREA
jgi:cytochrome c-type biogenesis protein CcmF